VGSQEGEKVGKAEAIRKEVKKMGRYEAQKKGNEV
jgi:hypothetical protein